MMFLNLSLFRTVHEIRGSGEGWNLVARRKATVNTQQNSESTCIRATIQDHLSSGTTTHSKME